MITKENVLKVLTDRLAREINQVLIEKRPILMEFISGYREAIQDIAYDLFEMGIFTTEEWKWTQKKIEEGKIKIMNIKLSHIETERKKE
jgi:hypothetical protein